MSGESGDVASSGWWKCFSKELLKIIYYMNWAVVFDRLKRSSYTNKIALQ
ncbi:MAG: hypothetical protein K2M50_03305 [Treponemataceae bacterium]|nr:hypothetical protein [Treponemataceae bacterium]